MRVGVGTNLMAKKGEKFTGNLSTNGGTTKLTKKLVKEALLEGSGVMWRASRIIGCNYSSLWEYMRRHSELLVYRDMVKDELLDAAEDLMLVAIKGGDTEMARFVVKQVGHRRGYGDQVERNGSRNGPITIQFQAAPSPHVETIEVGPPREDRSLEEGEPDDPGQRFERSGPILLSDGGGLEPREGQREA